MKIEELELLLGNARGALPYQGIEALKNFDFIKGSTRTAGPSSLDLVLSEECYEIKRFIMPNPGEKAFTLMKDKMDPKRLKSYTLWPGKKYLIRLKETFLLPRELYARTNPKSTTGRTMTHCRLVGDGVDRYDHVPRAWRGQLWVLVTPYVFPISYVPEVDSLNQMRFKIKNQRLTQMEILSMQHKYGIIKDINGTPIVNDDERIRGDKHGHIIFPIDCVGNNGIVGYRALPGKEALPIGGVSCSDEKQFFKPIKADEYLNLKKGYFYILSTGDIVSIPPEFAGEVTASDESQGEYRAHFAGYIDNAFGYVQSRPTYGNTITLEVLAHEDITLKHGQPIANLQLERMAALPEKLYGETSGTYNVQLGARLPKQFGITK